MSGLLSVMSRLIAGLQFWQPGFSIVVTFFPFGLASNIWRWYFGTMEIFISLSTVYQVVLILTDESFPNQLFNYFYNSIIPSTFIDWNSSVKGRFPSVTRAIWLPWMHFLLEKQKTYLIFFTLVTNSHIQVWQMNFSMYLKNRLYNILFRVFVYMLINEICL